jgi:hypothetical protein
MIALLFLSGAFSCGRPIPRHIGGCYSQFQTTFDFDFIKCPIIFLLPERLAPDAWEGNLRAAGNTTKKLSTF